MLQYQNFLIILSSPSGGGKSTISRMLRESDPTIKTSVSHTTRQQRPGEIEGKHYYFIAKEKYDKMEKNGEFLECAHVFGNYYGSSKKQVEKLIKSGNDIIFDIDWQGARQITEQLPPEKVLKIFILPPSISRLEKRLRARKQDSEEVVQRRMKKARHEISHYDEYEYVIINDNLDEAYEQIKSIIENKRIFNTEKKALKKFIKENF